jgi:hypothetical protein
VKDAPVARPQGDALGIGHSSRRPLGAEANAKLVGRIPTAVRPGHDLEVVVVFERDANVHRRRRRDRGAFGLGVGSAELAVAVPIAVPVSLGLLVVVVRVFQMRHIVVFSQPAQAGEQPADVGRADEASDGLERAAIDATTGVCLGENRDSRRRVAGLLPRGPGGLERRIARAAQLDERGPIEKARDDEETLLVKEGDAIVR